jgi:hypothetical protein
MQRTLPSDPSYLMAACTLLRRVAARMAARYKVDPRMPCSAEDYIGQVADRMFLGHVDRAGLRILQDFRGGALGSFALELPLDWVQQQQQLQR